MHGNCVSDGKSTFLGFINANQIRNKLLHAHAAGSHFMKLLLLLLLLSTLKNGVIESRALLKGNFRGGFIP